MRQRTAFKTIKTYIQKCIPSMQIHSHTVQKIKHYIQKNSPSIEEHSSNVSDVARFLAKQHGISSEKAEIAAWGHDLFRTLSEKDCLAAIKKHSVLLTSFSSYSSSHLFYHGPLAALEIPSLFAYHDTEVLNAIFHHTILSCFPQKLEAILFLADKLEPGKKRPHAKPILKLAEKNLFLALHKLISSMKDFNAKKGRVLHPNILYFHENFNNI